MPHFIYPLVNKHELFPSFAYLFIYCYKHWCKTIQVLAFDSFVCIQRSETVGSNKILQLLIILYLTFTLQTLSGANIYRQESGKIHRLTRSFTGHEAHFLQMLYPLLKHPKQVCTSS